MAIIKVKTGGITADAITDALIADDVVGTEHLTANEVDTTALGADAVTGAQLADDAVNSEHYTDGSVDTAHIADAQITTAKLSTAVFTGATDIGADLADADLILVDDGAGGTIRKAALSRVKTYTGGGITVADQWRITAAHAGIGYITANWERMDTDSAGLIGSAMTESSGVFTFPSTGTYLVTFVVDCDADSANVTYITAQISVTSDNSSYSSSSSAADSAEAGYRGSVNVTTLVNVSNTSNVKCKFYVGASGGTFSANGNTGYNRTSVQFIRLGDST